MTGFDLAAARRDTPGVAHVTHLDNAGSALPTAAVLEVVVDHLRTEAREGGYAAAADAADRIAAVYEAVARLLGARADEIALTDNATRAWDMAVYAFPFRPGDRVLTGRSEYASNAIAFLQLQRRHGIELVVVPDDGDGQIDLDALDRELARGAAMVALTHVPTSGGLVNPAAEVGALCRRHGTFYVLDACQAAGQLPLDVGELGCDVLSATGRKYLRAPRGTGFLYVRRETTAHLDPPVLDLLAATWTSDGTYEIREDARRFETWEAGVAGRLGLGAAVDHALALGVDTTWPVLRVLAATLRERLGEVPGVIVHDRGRVQGGIVTFTVDGMESAEVHRRLRAQRINTSVSLPEYARFDLGRRGLPPVVRASVHYYNDADEMDRLVTAVAAMRG